MNMRKIIAGLLAVTLLTLISLLTSATTVVAEGMNVTASVDKYITATFNYDTVAFGALTAGVPNNAPTPDNTDGLYNVTVDTNYLYKVVADVTTTLADDGNTIPDVNVKMDENSDKASLAVGDAVTLESEKTIADNVANTVTTDYHGLWLSVPAGQYAGSYAGVVTVTYANEA